MSRFNGRIKGLADLLASGEIEQKREVLHVASGKMCASGVACEMYRRNNDEAYWKPCDSTIGARMFCVNGNDSGMTYGTSYQVMEWYGVDEGFFGALVRMNDGGNTFVEIADWIYSVLDEIDFDEVGYNEVANYTLTAMFKGASVTVYDVYGDTIAQDLSPEVAATLISGFLARETGDIERVYDFKECYNCIMDLKEHGGSWTVRVDKMEYPAAPLY